MLLSLSDSQTVAIEVADAYLAEAGLQSYTDLLTQLGQTIEPLPVAEAREASFLDFLMARAEVMQ